jgi:CheY-like chemotaxis protein
LKRLHAGDVAYVSRTPSCASTVDRRVWPTINDVAIMQTSVEEVVESREKVALGCKEAARRRRMLVVGEPLCDRQSSDALAGWMDMDVETAENERIASILATISLVEDRPYEAVLIDMPMPDTGSLAAARWLRRHGWLGPIVACGDDVDGESRKRALESGCDGFIDKPLSKENVSAAYTKRPEDDVETPAISPQERNSPRHETPAENDTSLRPRGRVLVVEDALCMQAIVGAFLQKMELEVDMAVNGQVGCDMAMQSLADGRPYDVILMDIQMPKMNGKQATKWLREHEWKGPIIAVSMHSTDKDRASFLTAGCTDCLAKPITKDLLCGALLRYVQC